MAAGNNVLDEARSLISKRIAEIDSERKRLERALSELGGGGESSRRGPGRPRGSSSGGPARGPGRGGRGGKRRRKGGTRAEQALKVIEGNPGISASAIAEQLSIKPNYMYRVLGELENEGKIRKDGRQYFSSGESGGDNNSSPAEAPTQVEKSPAGSSESEAPSNPFGSGGINY